MSTGSNGFVELKLTDGESEGVNPPKLPTLSVRLPLADPDGVSVTSWSRLVLGQFRKRDISSCVAVGIRQIDIEVGQ